MDDAPRSQILKTTLIVGLLVLTGAGCTNGSKVTALSTSSTATSKSASEEASLLKVGYTAKEDFLLSEGFISGCWPLEAGDYGSVKPVFSISDINHEYPGTSDFFEAQAKDGWKVSEFCSERLTRNDGNSFDEQAGSQDVEYFVLSRASTSTSDLSPSGIAESRIGILDSSLVQGEDNGIRLSPIIHREPWHPPGSPRTAWEGFSALRLEKQWVYPLSTESRLPSRLWTYTVLAQTGDGITGGVGTWVNQIYRFDPAKGTIKEIYSCPMYQVCKSINEF